MNTVFALLSEFQAADVPLELICEKYLGITIEVALRQISEGTFNLPIYKLGTSQKSPWLVSIIDLAAAIDAARIKFLREMAELHRNSPSTTPLSKPHAPPKASKAEKKKDMKKKETEDEKI